MNTMNADRDIKRARSLSLGEKENSPPAKRLGSDDAIVAKPCVQDQDNAVDSGSNASAAGDDAIVAKPGARWYDQDNAVDSGSTASAPDHPAALLPKVKRKSRREHALCNYNTGKWTRDERLLFLLGLRAYGWGRWKEIGGTYLTTRCVQTKKYKTCSSLQSQSVLTIIRSFSVLGRVDKSVVTGKKPRNSYNEERT